MKMSNSSAANAQPPLGLKAIIEHLRSCYPDQPNPLQVTTLVKYWLGGTDPLDYISMYNHRGDQEKNIPPHWHYISFGLSDLHGDERVHVKDEVSDRSGMGFELTFRLLKTEKECGNEEQRPPTWPANLLQAIARYCFQTGNSLCVGDNIPWKRCLDGSNDNGRLKNILVAQDAQLGCIETPFGTVDFCQIVGVTDEELEQAARWNGRGVLDLLRQDPITGGEWLVTDMDRQLSVFILFPETLENLEDDLEKQGSDLAGINAEFTFREVRQQQQQQQQSLDKCIKLENEIDSESLNEQCAEDENNPMRMSGISEIKREREVTATNFPLSMSMSNSLHKSCPLDYQPPTPDSITLDGIEITLAPYAAKYLMLAIRDRIRHGRHFTFKSQHLALTLVAESVTGAAVNKKAPYGVVGYWIQVLIEDDLVPRMLEDFQAECLGSCGEITRRLEFDWPDKKLKLIVDQPRIDPLNL